jgi:peptidoglycan/LPS O-acetylase OafA/YrhL
MFSFLTHQRPLLLSSSAESHLPANNLAFRHFPQLDGLRGVAILMVITGHVLEFGLLVPAAGRIAGLGVMLFFVLSGFLITGSLNREICHTREISMSDFYFRRAFRLFPALFCFLAVLSLLIKIGVVTDTPWYTVVTCLIYVRNVWGRGSSSQHIWSLSVEEQFYSLWPCIMRALTRTGSLWTACIGAIAVCTFRMTAIYLKLFEFDGPSFYMRSWFRFDSILIGCATALWLCRSDSISKVQGALSRISLTTLSWAALLVWTLWGDFATHVWYLTVQMVLTALILVNLLLSQSPIYLRVFSNPVAAWLGKISYSWYLWQQLFTVFKTPTWLGSRTVPVNILISLLLAVLSYQFVERPFLRLRDNLIKCRPSSPPGAVHQTAKSSYPQLP